MIRSAALLIFVLVFTQTAFSQKKKIENDDVYNNNGTVDTISLTTETTFSFDQFVKGYLITSSNNQVDGLLKFNGNAVVFKDTITGKTKHYGAGEINGFVAAVVDTIKTHFFSFDADPISARPPLYRYSDKKLNRIRFLARGPDGYLKMDTFKVYKDTVQLLQNPRQPVIGVRSTVEKSFIKLMIYGNKLSLYKRVITRQMGPTMMNGSVMNGGYTTENIFYLKRNNEVQYTEVPSGRKAFKKMMVKYLKDDADLINDISKEQLYYSKLDKVVDRYNNDTNAR